MSQHSTERPSKRYFFRFILFISLLFSETTSLQFVQNALKSYKIPHFSLVYFVLATIFCLKTIKQYLSQPRNDTAVILECFEHVGILFSSFILKIHLGDQIQLTKIGIICGLLLIAQFWLMVVKILYFGSVIHTQIAQVSIILKLLRIFKLTFMAIMPYFIHSEIVFLAFFVIFQLFSVLIFCFKVTYQQSEMEQTLMIGTLGGMVSALEAIFQLLTGIPHFFLAQCLMLALFLFSQFTLRPLLEIKYLRLLTLANLRADSQTILSLFCFLRECLLQEEVAISFSEEVKGKSWQFFVQLLKIKKNIVENENFKFERDIWLKLFNDKKMVQQQFFELLCRTIHQKTHFQSFAFKLDCALKLKEKYIKYSLIMYYEYLQIAKNNLSILEKCKIQRVYKQIATKISTQNFHKTHKNYLKFSQKLTHFLQEFSKVISQELSILQQIMSRKATKNRFLDTKLINNYLKKQQFNNQFNSIFKDDLYLSSNELKVAILIYYISILKQPQFLKTQMKKHFASTSNTQRNPPQWKFSTLLVVLNGFQNGQIINFNESFKNKFKIVKKELLGQIKETISKYFATPTQGKLHTLKMNDFKTYKESNTHNHSEYQCWLAVQGEQQGQLLNCLQKYTVSTRIYYENSASFNYICQIQPVGPKNESSIIVSSQMLPRALETLKNVIVGFQKRKITQLEQEFQVFELYFSQQTNLSQIEDVVSSEQLILLNQTRSQKSLPFLSNTKQQIQKNIFENTTQKDCCSSFMLFEVGLIVCIGLVIMFIFVPVNTEVSKLIQSHTMKNIVRDAIVLRKKIYLQKQILNLVRSTPFFPSQVCQMNSIQNITTYVMQHFYADIFHGFDEVMNLAVSNFNSQELIETIFSQNQPSLNLLENQRNITFVQFVSFLKTSMIHWLDDYQNDQENQVDFDFYASYFPNNILKQSYDAEDTPFNIIYAIAEQRQVQLARYIMSIKLIVTLMGSLFVLTSMILRLKENNTILQYLDIIQNFPPNLVKSKEQQLKFALNRLSKLRINFIYQVTWQNEVVVVRASQKLFSSWQKRKNALYQTKKIENYCQDSQQVPLISKKTTINLPENSLTQTIKNSLLYNKLYLSLITLLLATFLFFCVTYMNNHIKKTKRIENYDQLTETISYLQENYINLLAYNWLKVTSLNMDFDMDDFQELFNDSIASLQQIQYQAKVLECYPRDIANLILYQNICQSIINASTCEQYRNGALTAGSSVLVTLIINQAIMFKQVSQNYTYHLPNLCDKTFLFFDVFMPLVKKIPQIASQMVDKANFFQGESMIVGIYLNIAAILVFTLVIQYVDRRKKRIIEKQLLSFDKVENLYKISELKPLLNKAYYL